MNKRFYWFLAVTIITAFTLTACGAPATEAPAEAAVEEVEEVVEEGPCLVIGATYGGPINDAGYNQAFHESVMKIKENIDCVEIVEAENVYDY